MSKQQIKMRKNTHKIVRLLDPSLCFQCRFSKQALVKNSSGDYERMINCTRLDCDNWDTKNSQSIDNSDISFDPSTN